MMKMFIRLFFMLALAYCAAPPAFAQTLDRRMIFDRYDCREPAAGRGDADSNCLVELVGVEIGGQKIANGQTFAADENWLKNLKVKIKNVSGRPFFYFGVSFGLIEGLSEELAPSASWGWGFALHRGRVIKSGDGKKKLPQTAALKPGETAELTFADMPDAGLKSPLLQAAGKSRQIVLRTAFVFFKDGEEKDSRIYINKKP